MNIHHKYSLIALVIVKWWSLYTVAIEGKPGEEVNAIVVFAFFTCIFFKNETIRWNHWVDFVLLVGADYFILQKVNAGIKAGDTLR